MATDSSKCLSAQLMLLWLMWNSCLTDAAPYFPRGPPANVTVVEGSDAQFHCDATVPTGEPAPSQPIWYISGHRINSFMASRGFVLSNGDKTLTIKNVNKATYDNKCGRCEVSNGIATIEATACLSVLVAIKIVKRPPAKQAVSYGGLVNLTVIATADPSLNVTYRWIITGTTYDILPPFITTDNTTKEMYINTSIYTVDEFMAIGGVYSITVYTEYENVSVNTEVIVASPTDGPSFPNGNPKNQTVLLGSNVNVQCKAEVPPDEQPLKPNSWYVDGNKLDTHYDQKRYTISPDYTVLTILDIHKGEAPLCVQCEVSNGVDTITASIFISVLLPITILKRPPPKQWIKKGGELDLTVEAKTDPSMTLEYRWEFVNKTFNGSINTLYFVRDLERKKIFIATIFMSMEEFKRLAGNYKIHISHAYENRTVETEVKIWSFREINTTPTHLDDFWMIIIVVIIAGIIAVTTAAIVCSLIIKRHGEASQRETSEVAQTEVEFSQTEVDASQTEVDASQTEVDASQTEVDASQTEVEVAQTEVEDGPAPFNTTELDESSPIS